MQSARPEMTFAIDGYEISATFADNNNEAALGQVKQILLSSFVSNAPKMKSKGILDLSLGRRDNIGGGSHRVP